VHSEQLVQPMLQAVYSDLASTIARCHHADFARRDQLGAGGGSAYASDLSERLWAVRECLLLRYDANEERARWCVRLALLSLLCCTIRS
jgi:hypothetical protein